MDGVEYFLELTQQTGQKPDLTGNDIATIHRKLWELLGKLTSNYTGAGSSSLRTETATALLQSACFLILLGLKRGGNSTVLDRLLIEKDYEVLFQKGLDAVKEEIKKGTILLDKAAETMLNVKNTAYTGTLDALKSFFIQYNYYYFAYEIPCLLDYPLTEPVSEKLFGIEYINEFLRRFVLENAFCGFFDAQTVYKLVERISPDDGLINIYETLVLQALASVLLVKDVQLSEMTKQDILLLEQTFREETTSEKWLIAVQTLSERLQLCEYAKAYLRNAADKAFLQLCRSAELGRLDVLLAAEQNPSAQIMDDDYYIDSEKLADEELRALIDELSNCRYVSDKITVVRQNINSMRDLFEVLNICFWGEESTALFESLDNSVLTLLTNHLRLREKRNPDWRSESGWEKQFYDFMEKRSISN